MHHDFGSLPGKLLGHGHADAGGEPGDEGTQALEISLCVHDLAFLGDHDAGNQWLLLGTVPKFKFAVFVMVSPLSVELGGTMKVGLPAFMAA
jgi:hypothetical protein